MPDNLTKFTNPPVDEVVIGVQFGALDRFKSAHFGEYWEIVRDRYPICEDQQSIQEILELSDGIPTPQVQRLIPDISSVLRCWFISQSGNELVQLQKNRFWRNWRKINISDAYPGYDYLMPEFKKELEVFERFITDNNLGELRFNQCEMTYFNKIEQGHGWNSLADIKGVFPFLDIASITPHSLNAPESISFEMKRKLPNNQGRIHVNISPVFRSVDFKMAMNLEITVRGQPTGLSNTWDWFDFAHMTINQVFCSLTSNDMHKSWGEHT